MITPKCSRREYIASSNHVVERVPITKFQEAYLEEYGEEVSAEVAEAELLGLAELVELTSKSIKEINKENEDEKEDVNKRIFR